LEFGGIPRWVAFEEHFIIVDDGDKVLTAAVRFRRESGRLSTWGS
jgi:hypothetical protein